MRKLEIVAARKKIGSARCEYYVFDVHSSEASKRLKMGLLHLWRINVNTTGGFVNIPVEDFTWLNSRHNNITNSTIIKCRLYVSCYPILVCLVGTTFAPGLLIQCLISLYTMSVCQFCYIIFVILLEPPYFPSI